MTQCRRFVAIAIVAVLVNACAAYHGRGLVPGQSKAEDVERVMGLPAERRAAANGDSIWYYPRGPSGLDTFAVRIGADGTMRSLEQILTVANVRKLVPRTSKKSDVGQLLGPPWRKTREGTPPREIWQYRMYDETRTECNFYVWFADDGLVADTLLIKDFSIEPGGRHR